MGTGLSFEGVKVWVRGGREFKTVRISCDLFADDNTIVVRSDAIDGSVKLVKSVMNEWEERNNDAKEEVLEFGTDEGGEMRVIRSF